VNPKSKTKIYIDNTEVIKTSNKKSKEKRKAVQIESTEIGIKHALQSQINSIASDLKS